MSRHYRLIGKGVVPCSLMTWAQNLEHEERKVAKDFVGKTRVSTTFLGLDHNFSGDGPPLIFETMVFGGEHDGYMDRYSTWAQAEEGHAKALHLLHESPNSKASLELKETE